MPDDTIDIELKLRWARTHIEELQKNLQLQKEINLNLVAENKKLESSLSSASARIISLQEHNSVLQEQNSSLETRLNALIDEQQDLHLKNLIANQRIKDLSEHSPPPVAVHPIENTEAKAPEVVESEVQAVNTEVPFDASSTPPPGVIGSLWTILVGEGSIGETVSP